MIYKNGKNITSVYKGSTPIIKIYKGLQVVWEAFKKFVVSDIPPLTFSNSIGEPLVDYKIYGNSKQAILPDEYQQVEYIEATGTQYFEIDYIANEKTNSRGTFQITDIDKANFLFGSRVSSTTTGCYGLNWGGGRPFKYYNTYYGNSNEGMTNTNIDTQKHDFEKIGNKLYIDGKLIHARKDTDGTIAFKTPTKMTIFACNTNGNIGLQTYSRLTFLSFDESEGDLFGLISCYRKSDGKIGMYDVVNNYFHTNQGTGEFLKGADVPSPTAPLAVQSVSEVIPISINGNITTINTTQPLRKVGEYADYVDYKNGNIVRKVGVKTFDGSENWETHKENNNNVVYRLDDVLTPMLNTPTSATYMTHFMLTNIYSTSSFLTGTYRFGFDQDNLTITSTRLYVSSDKMTLTEFKTWLAENKPTIFYPLATPIEESIVLPEIPTHEGTNILSVETEIKPSNVEITYKGK